MYSLLNGNLNESVLPFIDMWDKLYESKDIAHYCILNCFEGKIECRTCKLREKIPRRTKEQIKASASKLEHDEKNQKELIGAITRKFSDILEALGFNGDDRKMLQADNAKERGHLLFFPSVFTSQNMCEIIRLWDNKENLFSFEDGQGLIIKLADMLPPFRNHDDFKKYCDLSTLREKGKLPESDEKTLKDLQEKRNDIYKNKERIYEIVHKYVVEQYALYYEAKCFTVFSQDHIRSGIIRKTLYGMQYQETKKWYERWREYRNEIQHIREAESFYLNMQGTEEKDGLRPSVLCREFLRRIGQKGKILCHNCGTEIREGSNFCSICGMSVAAGNLKPFSEGERDLYEGICKLEVEGLSKEECLNKCQAIIYQFLSEKNSSEIQEDIDILFDFAFREIEETHYEFVRIYNILSYSETIDTNKRKQKQRDMENYYAILEGVENTDRIPMADIIHNTSKES